MYMSIGCYPYTHKYVLHPVYGVKMLSAKKLSAASTSAWVNEGFSG